MFLLFSGNDCYTDGGWDDYKGCYDTLEEAKIAAVALDEDWWQIVDLSKKEIILTRNHMRTQTI